MSTGVVILAAGESARMGEPKQLLCYGGKTLLQRAIDTALAVADAPVVVVLGAHAAKIRPRLGESGLLVAEHAGWRDGMGGSLRVGLAALLAAQPAISAALILACDQPLLTAQVLKNIIATHERTGRSIVASEYVGVLGVPALFVREFFPELLALHGEEGARQIIRRHRAHAVGVPFLDGVRDIDTPDDFRALNEAAPTPPAAGP